LVGKVGARPTTQQNDSELKLRFGGGLNTRASDDEVDERECADGYNFSLDLGDTQFRPRLQFDLAGTAPNAGSIRGFAQLVKTDGTVSTLIQAGGIVYETDFTTWTSRGSISSSSKIRGPYNHIWNLDDVVLISDVAGVNPVMQWDGSSLDTIAHNLSGDFIAKYIHVDNERAFFGNVISNSVETPHVIVGSQLQDYTVLSTSSRPTSALGTSDAWYLPVPDLKAINGMVGAFGIIALSTKRGKLYQLTGEDSQDFAIDPMYPGSYADGDESMVYVGNDIAFGRPGRLESLIATNNYADVETDDLSFKIFDSIKTFGGWTLSYSSRHQRIYCHPNGQNELWVFHKPIAQTGLSPWMKWTTQHSMNFNPVTMWTMLDPVSGLEHVFCGDTSGNVYRLEGTGSGGDANSTNIRASRTSKLVPAPARAQVYDVQGTVKFRSGNSQTLSMTMLWQGETVFNTPITVSIPAAASGAVYGGGYYYNGTDSYYGSAFSGRLVREIFAIAGEGNEVQLKTEINGATSFEINEIFLGFRAAG